MVDNGPDTFEKDDITKITPQTDYTAITCFGCLDLGVCVCVRESFYVSMHVWLCACMGVWGGLWAYMLEYTCVCVRLRVFVCVCAC